MSTTPTTCGTCGGTGLIEYDGVVGPGPCLDCQEDDRASDDLARKNLDVIVQAELDVS